MTVTSAITICGIPMSRIPHPQGPWLEGINPVTNLQWERGVEPFMNGGAKYCLLEPHYRGDLTARHFGDYKDLLDRVGHDNVPKNWKGETTWLKDQDLFLFQWRRTTSRNGFDGKGQPAVDVSWAEAKAWTLVQGGLYLLTDKQWEWSGQGGEKNLEYATPTGKLFGPDGKKLAHCSVGTEEQSTIDVNDSLYADGPFGLRHKTGNVWEWVERNHNEEYQYGLRGGSWINDSPEILRVAYRLNGHVPDVRLFDVGFRVGASVPRDSK